ncbi:MAG TPA: hypothetical protein VH062_35695 [Polyangiaceae bacterium]|jgi:hypothetical protein|nr:hypothetical protein [Polyangiaceae bacterium]
MAATLASECSRCSVGAGLEYPKTSMKRLRAREVREPTGMLTDVVGGTGVGKGHLAKRLACGVRRLVVELAIGTSDLVQHGAGVVRRQLSQEWRQRRHRLFLDGPVSALTLRVVGLLGFGDGGLSRHVCPVFTRLGLKLFGLEFRFDVAQIAAMRCNEIGVRKGSG